MNFLRKRVCALVGTRRGHLVDDYRAHGRMFNVFSSASLADSAYASGCMVNCSLSAGENSVLLEVEGPGSGDIRIGRGSILRCCRIYGDVTIGDNCMLTGCKLDAGGGRIVLKNGCVLNSCTVHNACNDVITVGDNAIWEGSMLDVQSLDSAHSPKQHSLGCDSLFAHAILQLNDIAAFSAGDRLSILGTPAGSTTLDYFRLLEDTMSDMSSVQAALPVTSGTSFISRLYLHRDKGVARSPRVVLGDDVVIWGKWRINIRKGMAMGSGARLWNAKSPQADVSRREIRMGRNTRLVSHFAGGDWETVARSDTKAKAADLIIEDDGQLLINAIDNFIRSVTVPRGSKIV